MTKNSSLFAQVLDIFLKIIRTVLAPILSEVDQQRLDKIITRLEWYQIAVVGKPGLGKSTFFNALIGQQLLPSSGGDATTGVPTYIYHHPTQTRVQVIFKNGTTQTIEPTQTAIAEYINSVNQQRTDIKEIRIETPIRFVIDSGFKGKFCLIDTPGEGTVAAKDHSEVTRNLIKEADAIIVLNEQRQLNTTDVTFLSNDIKAVRKDLLEQNATEAIFDNKLIICLNKIDLDENYVKNGDFAPKCKKTAELLKGEGLNINTENICGLAAEPALLSLLIQQAIGKKMEDIYITDLEKYETAQTRGTIARDNASKLKTYLDNIANKRQLDDPSLQILFDMTLLQNFETKLLQHLQGDLKTPPLRKALTQANDLAQNQINVYNADLNETNKQLETAIKIEKEQRQAQNQAYLHEKQRIEGQKNKLELQYEQEKNAYTQQRQLNNERKKELTQKYDMQQPLFKLQKENITKELSSLSTHIQVIKTSTSNLWNHYSTSEDTVGNYCYLKGWKLSSFSPFGYTEVSNATSIHNKLEGLNSQLHNTHSNITSMVQSKLAHQRIAILSLFSNLMSNSGAKTPQPQTPYLLPDYERKSPNYLDLSNLGKYLQKTEDKGMWGIHHYWYSYHRTINALPKQDIDKATETVCAYITDLAKDYQATLTKGFDTLISAYKKSVESKVATLEAQNKALEQKIEQLIVKKNKYFELLNAELANFVAPNASAPLENEQIKALKVRINLLKSTSDTFKKETVDVFSDLLKQLTTK